MTVFDSFLTVFECIDRFDRFWRLLTVVDRFWPFLKVFDGFWPCFFKPFLTVSMVLKVFKNHIWPFWTVFDILLQYTLIDDGWWKKVQRVQKPYIYGWWMIKESTESAESTKSIHWWMMVESTSSTEWDILIKHFDKTILWNIFMRHFHDTFWKDISIIHQTSPTPRE